MSTGQGGYSSNCEACQVNSTNSKVKHDLREGAEIGDRQPDEKLGDPAIQSCISP